MTGLELFIAGLFTAIFYTAEAPQLPSDFEKIPLITYEQKPQKEFKFYPNGEIWIE